MTPTQIPFDGAAMHALGRRLWPIHRSITGDGTRKTLEILSEYLPNLLIHEVPSGTEVFDWTIPNEWAIRSATLTSPDGTTIVDLRDSNLHVVGYSIPVDVHLSLDDLQEHLHSIPEQPDAILYVTSYYNPRWGFCLTHQMRESLKPGQYHARIDSTIAPGSLTYGECVIPGESADEIFVSTYVCHPSLANNELSGPLVATGLAQAIAQMPNRHYTYRIVFAPETIGAITYAATHLEELQEHVVAAFNLTCIGDDRAFTYLASRHGNLRIDRIARRAIAHRPNARIYSYLQRGSDERHYGAPGVELPMISLMRSRYADYPEYHTSLDDLESVVTPDGLQGGLEFVLECIDALEHELVFTATQRGEPQLGKRGLYHTLQKKTTPEDVMLRTDILAYADGQHSIQDLADLLDRDPSVITALIDELRDHSLLIEHHQEPAHRNLWGPARSGT